MNIRITKTIVVSVIFIVVAVLTYFALFFDFANKKQPTSDINSITDSEIIEILKTNSDVLSYISRNSDFKIESKEILTKDSILAGQNGQQFQPVYIGLELEDDRYMKVQLINQSGSEGYITVIDFSDNTVQKAFGLLLFQASANAGSVKDIEVPK